MIILLENPATKEDIEKASEEFKDFFKVTVDVNLKKIAIGGELHADAEKVFLREGSHQNDIWGGGIDILNKIISIQAMINLRPNRGNDSLDILDIKARDMFTKMCKEYLSVALE